jgi:hypothetical protein
MVINNSAEVLGNNIQQEIYAASFVLPPIGKLFTQYDFFNFKQKESFPSLSNAALQTINTNAPPVTFHHLVTLLINAPLLVLLLCPDK